MDNGYILYCALMVLQGLLFAGVDVFSKVAFESVPVLVFMTFRMGLTSLILFLARRKTITHDIRTVSPSLYILPASCLGVAIILSNIAVHYTAATSFAFIRSLTAVIAPLLMSIFFSRKYTLRDVLIQIMLVAGLYLLFAKGGLSGFGIGDILAFVCATLVATALVFGAEALKNINPVTMTFVQMSVGTVCGAVAGLVTGSFSRPWVETFFKRDIILVLLYCIFLGSLLGYIIQNKALGKISPATVGILQCAYPVFTMILADAILMEKLSTQGMIGSAIIIACIIAQSTEKRVRKIKR